MSLDSATDALIDAMVSVAGAAANTTLASALGEDAVATTAKWPVSQPDQVGANNLPVLAVSRLEERDESETLSDDAERVTIRIAYIADATPVDARDDRWPLLRAVWSAVKRALREGVYPQFGDNESDMSKAGVSAYVSGSARVQYAILQGTDTFYPSFVATMAFEVSNDDLFNRDDLDDLALIHNEINTQPEHNDDPETVVDVALEPPV